MDLNGYDGSLPLREFPLNKCRVVLGDHFSPLTILSCQEWSNAPSMGQVTSLNGYMSMKLIKSYLDTLKSEHLLKSFLSPF